MKKLTLLLCLWALPSMAGVKELQPEEVLAKCQKKFSAIEDQDYCVSHAYGVPSYIRPQFVGCMVDERAGDTGLIHTVSAVDEPEKTDIEMLVSCLEQL